LERTTWNYFLELRDIGLYFRENLIEISINLKPSDIQADYKGTAASVHLESL